jgi:hypothetical protein
MSLRVPIRLLRTQFRFQSQFQAPARLNQLSAHFRPLQIRTMATEIPKTMKAVVIEKTGGVEVLEYRTDYPVPTPKEGEVLVKNDFIGINYIDTYGFSSRYFQPTASLITD